MNYEKIVSLGEVGDRAFVASRNILTSVLQCRNEPGSKTTFCSVSTHSNAKVK